MTLVFLSLHPKTPMTQVSPSHHTPNPTTKNKNLWYTNPMVLIFVIGLPALVVVVCIFFIMYSIKIQDSTVRDDWYMDGKALYADASRDQLAYDLGVAGIMTFEGNQATFFVNYPKDSTDSGTLRNGQPLSHPKELNLSISHATDKQQDQDLVLTHSHDNVYVAEVSDILPAKYYIVVSDQATGWRLIHAYNLPTKTLALTPLDAYGQKTNELPDQRDKRFNP